MSDTVRLSVTLPAELHERLAERAAADKRSIAFVIVEAAEEHLDFLETLDEKGKR